MKDDDIFIEWINRIIRDKNVLDYEENVASKSLIMLTIPMLKHRLKQPILTVEILTCQEKMSDQ